MAVPAAVAAAVAAAPGFAVTSASDAGLSSAGYVIGGQGLLADNFKVLGVFNHKGGVGKTTTTANISWSLARQGHNTLVIDLDPQCNITGFMVDPGFDLLRAQQNPNNLDASELFYQRYPRANLRSALAPMMGTQEVKTELNITPAELNGLLLTDVFRVADRNTLLPDGVAPFTHPPNNLFLLGGHPELHEYEEQIISATQSANASNIAPDIPGAFFELCRRLAKRYAIEYVVVDMSPSAWVVNKLMVSSCHFLLVPCSCDFYSAMAIRGLAKMLFKWDDWKESIRDMIHKSRNVPRFALPAHKPIFIGHTFQLYTVTNDGSGDPADAFRRWIFEINRVVENDLVPQLHLRGMVMPRPMLPPLLVGGNDPRRQPIQIGQVRNAQSVGVAATKCHMPVFEMTAALCKLADTSSTHSVQVLIPALKLQFDSLRGEVLNRWAHLTGVEQRTLVNVQTAVSFFQRFGTMWRVHQRHAVTIESARALNQNIGLVPDIFAGNAPVDAQAAQDAMAAVQAHQQQAAAAAGAMQH